MDLEWLVNENNGVAPRALLLECLPRPVVDSAIRRGEIVRALPGVYVHAALLDDPATRIRAAVAYTAGRCAASHASALAWWGLLDWPEQDHVLVPHTVRLAGSPRLRLHRSRTFVAEPPHVVRRDSLPVVPLADALVESWPLLDRWVRREAAITAVRSRQTTPHRLLAACAAAATGARPLRELTDLCALLGDGAHSEFEVWGVQHFFDPDLLGRSRGQLPVRLGNRQVYLDRGFEEEMVDVELDGTRWHDHPYQREVDRRRDEALAAAGWLTVRFSWRRLTGDAPAARARLRAILATRRTQLGLPPVA